MPTNRTPLQRPRRLSLSREQAESLQYGDLPGRPAFADDEERRAAWFAHRDRLLMHCSHGQRPAGWWDYECPVPRPRDRDHAEAALFEAGLLAEREVEELVAQWRRDFERTQESPVHVLRRLCEAGRYGRDLDPGQGRQERRSIDGAEFRKGCSGNETAERRRRSNAIRQLETAAAEQPAA